jgi:hypothetical protein
MRKEYPVILAKAVNILLQFLRSYPCKRAFSCLRNFKSEGTSRLLSVK